MVTYRQLVVVAFWPHFFNFSDEHATRTRYWIVHFPARANDLKDLGSNGITITTVLVGQLSKARCIQIEPMNPNPYLTTVQLRRRIQAPCCLREHPRGLKYPMQPYRAYRMTHETTLQAEAVRRSY